MEWNIASDQFARVVASIQRRAEKQTDLEKLTRIYVPNDLFIRSTTSDSQLITGRRGTGKTHLMRVFEQEQHLKGDRVYYFDCTRLGSGYSGLDIQPEELAKKYFIAFLNDLGSQLLDAASRMEAPPAGTQERVLSMIIDGLGSCIAPSSKLDGPSFNYRQITEVLDKIIEGLQIKRLFVVLDEWAQVPFHAQPYLADYVKHGILPVRPISLKILAVSYQCQFYTVVGSDLVGLQRGADIPDVVDMDSYLVFDEEKEAWMAEFFGQVLYNHLAMELDLPLELSAEAKHQAILQLFTQQATFVELVRAAEGNCRDFLCIFGKAYFEGFRQAGGANSISIPHVRTAAGNWFATEKESNVRAEQEVQSTLAYIMNNVIKEYKSRTFMVAEAKADHVRIRRLLNERIIHRLNLTYSHPDRPGERYALFTIDYGAYVRFKGTINEPSESILVATESIKNLAETNYMVPFDKLRSIRRVIFDPDQMQIQPTLFDL